MSSFYSTHFKVTLNFERDLCLSYSFMKVVVTDLQHRLLSKMEEMIKLEGRSPCIAIQAWGWFVKLLGVKSTEEKSLINVMLKLLEESFVSPSAQVRSASQVHLTTQFDCYPNPKFSMSVRQSCKLSIQGRDNDSIHYSPFASPML